MNKKTIGAIALALFVVIIAGLIWLATLSTGTAGALLSFAAGLSMIFLPCTLPLALVIVPIAAKEEKASKGIGLAVAFGLGLTLTITFYGIITAVLGDFFGLDQFTRIMFVVAGIMAIIFALSELGLINIKLPVLSHSVPNWIQQGYGKTFLLGLFLGNAGIGCPNPAFYVLLTYIASTGSVLSGSWLGFVHGLGRATPLIFLVLLALLGVKSKDWLSDVSKRINVLTGGALIAVGAFILTYGLFGMHWWEDSIFHAGWNSLLYSIDPAIAEDPDHPVAKGVWKGSMWMGWGSIIVLVFIPMLWYYLKQGMGKVKFWVITILLLLLGGAATTGILRVEHAHGAAGSNHNEQQEQRTEVQKNQEVPEHTHKQETEKHDHHIHGQEKIHIHK